MGWTWEELGKRMKVMKYIVWHSQRTDINQEKNIKQEK